MSFKFALLLSETALLVTVTLSEAQQSTPDYNAIVEANTRFALIAVRARASQLKENEVVSSIALSTGFALLRNGASSQCADEIGNAFVHDRCKERTVYRHSRTMVLVSSIVSP